MISESGFNPYLSVVVTHEDTIRDNPAEVEAMIKATQLGWEHYLKNPEKTNVEMQKLNPSLDLATFHEGAQLQKPFIESLETKKRGVGFMSLERWKKLYDQLISLKLVKAGMNPQSFFLKK